MNRLEGSLIPDFDVKYRRVTSIAAPLVSFAVLAIVVVSAVVVGNLSEEPRDGCWPADRSAATGDEVLGWPIMVWSEDSNELMLCDVGAETVKYEPPERSESGFWIGNTYHFQPYDGQFVALEGNDLARSEQSILLYKKGEFGEVEDCYDNADGLEGREGIPKEDLFGMFSDPDNVEFCWMEIEYFTDTEVEE